MWFGSSRACLEKRQDARLPLRHDGRQRGAPLQGLQEGHRGHDDRAEQPDVWAEDHLRRGRTHRAERGRPSSIDTAMTAPSPSGFKVITRGGGAHDLLLEEDCVQELHDAREAQRAAQRHDGPDLDGEALLPVGGLERLQEVGGIPYRRK